MFLQNLIQQSEERNLTSGIVSPDKNNENQQNEQEDVVIQEINEEITMNNMSVEFIQTINKIPKKKKTKKKQTIVNDQDLFDRKKPTLQMIEDQTSNRSFVSQTELTEKSEIETQNFNDYMTFREFNEEDNNNQNIFDDEEQQFLNFLDKEDWENNIDEQIKKIQEEKKMNKYIKPYSDLYNCQLIELTKKQTVPFTMQLKKDPKIDEQNYVDKKVNLNIIDVEKFQALHGDNTIEQKKWISRNFESIKIKNNNYFTTDNFQDGLISMYAGNSVDNNYILQAKIAICITMYNEDQVGFQRSMKGIYDNIKQFNKIGIKNHEILVVVVQDGITKIYKDDIESNDKCMISKYTSIMNNPDATNRYNIHQYRIDELYNKILYLQKLSSLKGYLNQPIFEGYINQFNFNWTEKEFSIFRQTIKAKKQELTNALIKQKRETFLTDQEFENIQNDSIQYAIDFFIKKYKFILSQHENRAVLIQCRSHYSAFDFNQAKLLNMNKIENWKKKNEDNILNSRKKVQLNNKKLLEQVNIENIKQSDYMYQLFVVKFGNYKKLNSHLWFFGGFCELLNPEVTILIDCGAKPMKDALIKMYLSIKCDYNLGGVCGFMGLQSERMFKLVEEENQNKMGFFENIFFNIFDIQKAQIFEYGIAHIFDKAIESTTGFIHVLPGAFSGYRWDALKADRYGSILDNYLKTELHTSEKDKFEYTSIQEANKYLAEDRILCLKLYAKLGKQYTLKYLCDCVAVVDPVTDLLGLMGQRRRWINGSWFALDYVLEDQQQIDVKKSQHNLWNLFWFQVNIYFSKYNKMQSYMMISFYYSLSALLIQANFGSAQLILNQNLSFSDINYTQVFSVIYVIVLISLIYQSLNYPANSPLIGSNYYKIAMFLGIITLLITVIGFFITYKLLFYNQEQLKESFNESEIGMDITELQFLVRLNTFMLLSPMIFQLNRLWLLAKSFISYTYFAPTYIHIFLVYAFCRIDDLSWGTKGVDGAEQSNKIFSQNALMFKYMFAGQWLMYNLLLIIFLQMIFSFDSSRKFFLIGFGYFITVISVIKTSLNLFYYIHYYGCTKRQMNIKYRRMRQQFKTQKQHLIEKDQQIKNLLNNLD